MLCEYYCRHDYRNRYYLALRCSFIYLLLENMYYFCEFTNLFSFCILDKTGWNHKTCCAASIPAVLHINQWFKSPFIGEHIQVIFGNPNTCISDDSRIDAYVIMLLSISIREDEYLVNMQHTVIPSWYQREGYIKAMATLIENELTKFSEPQKVRSKNYGLKHL